jgi:hypothetical protein
MQIRIHNTVSNYIIDFPILSEQEMEEAGIDWSCKTCKEQVAKAETPPSTNQEDLMETEPAQPPPSDEGGDQETSPTAASSGRRARAAARRQQSGGDSQEAKPKAKAARCHMCSKPPRLSSIYCSGKYRKIIYLHFLGFLHVS